LGNSDRELGPARGFPPALVGEDEIGAGRFIGWLDITASKFYDWRARYGKVNEHNGWVPRGFWLEDWEKQAIIGFHPEEPAGGLPPADVHDARCRHRGGESDQCMAHVGAGGTFVQVELVLHVFATLAEFDAI
jgi:hypothetical protein